MVHLSPEQWEGDQCSQWSHIIPSMKAETAHRFVYQSGIGDPVILYYCKVGDLVTKATNKLSCQCLLCLSLYW